jgi:hypothetical protein
MANIEGELIRAGTFRIDGEEVTGVFVSVSVSALRAAESIPLYRRVEILEFASPDEYQPGQSSFPPRLHTVVPFRPHGEHPKVVKNPEVNDSHRARGFSAPGLHDA